MPEQVLYVEALYDGMDDYEPLGVMTYRDLIHFCLEREVEGAFRMLEVGPLVDNGPA